MLTSLGSDISGVGSMVRASDLVCVLQTTVQICRASQCNWMAKVGKLLIPFMIEISVVDFAVEFPF